MIPLQQPGTLLAPATVRSSQVLSSGVSSKQAAGLRAADEVSPRALEKFYELMYPARASFLKQHWRWLYRVGTFPSVTSPLVAMRGEEVIGHAGLIPITLRRNGEERTAIWFVDLGILPEYQRQGIGMQLTQAVMNCCPLRLGLCNERSMGVLQKFSWEIREHISVFRLLLRPDRNPKFRRAPFRFLGTLAGLTTRVAWRARTLSLPKLSISPATATQLSTFHNEAIDSVLHVPRSPSFLHWRVETHPLAREHMVVAVPTTHGHVQAALVRVAGNHAYRRLHLLCLASGSRSRNSLSDLFASIVRWALHEDIHEIVFVTSDLETARIARWWFPIYTRIRFACHANEPAGRKFLSGTNHLWEYIDSDLDLMYE